MEGSPYLTACEPRVEARRSRGDLSSPPPAFTNRMARFLCWHIQEQAFGGLDPETAKRLDGLARGDKPGADHPRRLKPGTMPPARIPGRAAHRHGRSKRLFLARDDLCQPFHYRAGHHRHELERTALLWATKRRGAKDFVGSGQCVAGTRQQATSYSGGQVASGWRGTKSSRR